MWGLSLSRFRLFSRPFSSPAISGDVSKHLKRLRVQLNAKSQPPIHEATGLAKEFLQSIEETKEPLQSSDVLSIVKTFHLAKDSAMCVKILAKAKSASVAVPVEAFNLAVASLIRNPRDCQQLVDRSNDFGLPPTIRTFSLLMRSYSLAHDTKGCEVVLERMSGAGIKPDAQLFSTMLSAHDTPEWREKVFRFMHHHGVEPDGKALFMLLSSYAKSSQFEKYRRVFDHIMKLGHKPDIQSCTTLLIVYARQQDMGECDRIFSQMIKAQIPLEPIYFIKMFTVNSDEAWIRSVLDRMAHYAVPKQISFYNAVIRFYADAGDLTRCELLVHILQEEGLKLTGDSFNCLALAYVNRKDASGCEAVITRMISSGYSPTLLIFNRLMAAHTTAAGCRATFDQLLGTSLRPDEMTFSAMILVDPEPKWQQFVLQLVLKRFPDPQLPAFVCLLNAFAKMGSLKEMEQLFQLLRQSKLTPSLSAFHSLMQTFSSTSNLLGCDMLIREMLSFQVQPESHTFVLMTRISSGATVEWQRSVLDRMLERGLSPPLEVFNRMMLTLSRAGRTDECELVFKNIMEAGLAPDIFTFNSLMFGYRNCHKLDQLASVLNRMLDLNVQPTQATFDAMIPTAASPEWCSLILKLTEERSVACVRAFNSLMNRYAQSGLVDHCEQTLSRMIAAGLKPDILTYSSLMLAAAKQQDVPKCESILARTLEASVVPDAALFNAMMTADQSVEWRESIMERMRQNNVPITSETFLLLMQSRSFAGSIEACEVTLAELEKSGLSPNLPIFNSMMSVYAKLVDTAGCTQLLNRIIALGLKPDVYTFNAMLSADKSLEWLEYVLSCMQNHRISPDVVTFRFLIRFHMRNGSVEACERTLRRLSEAGLLPEDQIVLLLARLCALHRS